MKPLLIVVAFAFAAAGCAVEPPSASDYVTRIAAARAAKNAAFKNQAEPVPENLKDTLLPLVYYPPDPEYDVPAALEPSTDTRTLQMVYSDGAIRDVRRVGTLEFTLKGERLRLAAFVEVEARDLNNLFVPFGDRTNGTETYPAGRILDLERTASGLYDLDFNRAYNPSCYFSPTYSCPVPPKENRLPIAVQAGEKTKAK
jgi:hypothetical protein